MNITVRMPESIKEKLAACAKKEHRSLNNYIVHAAIEYAIKTNNCIDPEDAYTDVSDED